MPSEVRHISHRILVADNDPVTRQLLTSIIELEGYTAIATEDGRAAYRHLLSGSDFAAVVLDMTMPHLRGLDIACYMQTEKRLMRIPVIMISSDIDLGVMADSFAAGATAFLRKPFAAQQLTQTLRMLVNQNRPGSPHSRPNGLAFITAQV